MNRIMSASAIATDESRADEALHPPADPEPDGRLDPDAIEDLGDRIALLAAEITASKHELPTLIARFDATRGWKPGGHRGCADWLSFRTGMNLGTAREHVRVALALRELPKLRASMARGALSFCKARALTRVAKPETEADLLPLAEGATTAEVERLVRAFRIHSRLEEEALERERYLSRKLSIYPEGGMYVLAARLTAEDGASLMQAIDEEQEVLYRTERKFGERPHPTDGRRGLRPRHRHPGRALPGRSARRARDARRGRRARPVRAGGRDANFM